MDKPLMKGEGTLTTLKRVFGWSQGPAWIKSPFFIGFFGVTIVGMILLSDRVRPGNDLEILVFRIPLFWGLQVIQSHPIHNILANKTFSLLIRSIPKWSSLKETTNVV